ncbi:MAG TPA: FlgD immunoglobulin-like domain containing protein, partial [Candidatus Krumholzibacteria bacterium]|nr:FlgD immunoglobulin-like domain containing protein [Candidatus Krumholzibacteria bacterium]
EVFSVSGARVRTLARNEPFAAGPASLRWNGRDDGGNAVASGIYFISVKTPAGERIARAVLLK